MIPQIILLCLLLLSLGFNINNHGKISDKPKNAIYSFIGFLLLGSLLLWGGYFDIWIK